MKRKETTTMPKGTIQNDTEMPAEVLASEIEKVAESASRIASSRLTRKAILVLLANDTGMSQSNCGKVLDAAANLKSWLKR